MRRGRKARRVKSWRGFGSRTPRSRHLFHTIWTLITQLVTAGLFSLPIKFSNQNMINAFIFHCQQSTSLHKLLYVARRSPLDGRRDVTRMSERRGDHVPITRLVFNKPQLRESTVPLSLNNASHFTHSRTRDSWKLRLLGGLHVPFKHKSLGILSLNIFYYDAQINNTD